MTKYEAYLQLKASVHDELCPGYLGLEQKNGQIKGNM